MLKKQTITFIAVAIVIGLGLLTWRNKNLSEQSAQIEEKTTMSNEQESVDTENDGVYVPHKRIHYTPVG